MKLSYYFLTIILTFSINNVFASNEARAAPTEDEVKEYINARTKKIKELANSGIVSFQEELARMYYFGEPGVDQSYQESLKWYETAAFNGDSRSQNELGLMYSNGLGTEKNQKKATEWYLKAAENEWGGAYLVVANRYLNGIGIDKDCEKSIYWYKKHSESKWLSPATSIKKLEKMYLTGNCVTKDIKEAYKYHLIYNKIALHPKFYRERKKLKEKLNEEQILEAEEDSKQWLRTHAPNKSSNK